MTLRPRSQVRLSASVATAAAALLVLAGCSGTPEDDDASTIVRTTTAIAGASVVGIERDTTTACPAQTPVDPGLAAGGTHLVTHGVGETDVPVDPQRIVVLDSTAMDSVCALGLWERVVGAGADEGPTPQPPYLGTGISEIPGIGPAVAPDVALIAEAQPDLILGSSPASADLYDRLGEIAPTVFTGSDPVAWKEQFVTAGSALGRADAAAAALSVYEEEAQTVGTDVDAAQTQASVVRFSPETLSIQGPESFAGQVLADTGVRRPSTQRISPAATEDVTEDIARAEGDIVYVVIGGEASKKHAETVMTTDAWEELEAAKDRRIFVVEGSVWNGNGLAAARAILTDLRNTLNAYSGG
ncbi:ABC transporter substrate-binding protein [Rhodococcus triatomae]|uniref:Iron complex transport system substrate-binding protein n=1 Tax=Rhodococcus triatomae TaxID=300028 RepID=A0A1G8EVI7_9NOCA|nr:ABC transporter substrate-binding protein [Rhodococcus triatomae]QNG19307.1 ABC transporter substrate-binding protein [Rhodococcus triatomae]QNG24780.1 ABC transporter substrate-binding protein [Rhodococcus triatomae]SDH73921.1 iron complex transport system substrate-binding protein [Rhodococcus triatomae]